MVGTRWIGNAIAGLLVVQGLAGCNSQVPSAPTPAAFQFPTPQPIPQPVDPYGHRDVTLWGFITDSDNKPVQWLWVYCEVCGAPDAGGHTYAWADAQGSTPSKASGRPRESQSPFGPEWTATESSKKSFQIQTGEAVGST